MQGIGFHLMRDALENLGDHFGPASPNVGEFSSVCVSVVIRFSDRVEKTAKNQCIKFIGFCTDWECWNESSTVSRVEI